MGFHRPGWDRGQPARFLLRWDVPPHERTSAVIRARGPGQALVHAEGDFGRAELAQCVHNLFTEGCIRIAGIIVSE